MNSWELRQTINQLESLRFIFEDDSQNLKSVAEVINVRHIQNLNSFLITIYENTIKKNYNYTFEKVGNLFIKVNKDYFEVTLRIFNTAISNNTLKCMQYLQDIPENFQILDFTSNGNKVTTSGITRPNNSYALILGKEYYQITKEPIKKEYIINFLDECFLKENNNKPFQTIGVLNDYITINDIVIPCYSKILSLTSDEVKLEHNLHENIIPLKLHSYKSNIEKSA